ncbi:hypothetical protein F4861DRAFT_539842 [Xylaria intraflava]|nr:hypothetical protein F4861DRAFT_539842 [Xylaria intraflava]
MSGHPTTGTPSLYENGDERNYSRDAIRKEQRHHLRNVEGYMRSKYSHKATSSKEEKDHDPKSQLNSQAENQHKAMEEMIDEHTQIQIEERYKNDPLYRATINGNKPSRGAVLDAEIQAEEAKMLEKKAGKTDSMVGKKLERKSSREQ